MADHAATVRDYYRALDEDDYDLLAAVLAPEFVHERPDRTIEGRERFVQFMREERPMTDTSHPLDAVYERTDEDGGEGSDGRGNGDGGTVEIAARGRLLRADGDRLVSFLDVFTFAGEGIGKLRTYTH